MTEETPPPDETHEIGEFGICRKRQSTKFLKRHVLPSDNHDFVGRLYDLGIVGMNFDNYEELAQFPDCKYAVDNGHMAERLAYRVESLNMVGDLLWPTPFPKDFQTYPVSHYEWLVVAADVFLMRYISVVDCALLLVNEVYETGLRSSECTLSRLKKKGVPHHTVTILEAMLSDQGNLRPERNARVHHGIERAFTIDDRTFKIAALFKRRANGMTGKDYYGRPIHVQRSFKEGLVGLQRTFNVSTKILIKRLNQLYDVLRDEFEDRFGPRIADATHGLNARAHFHSV